MFRYLEIIVLNKQIEYLQNITYDVYNSFNSEELKQRISIVKGGIKPELTFQLLFIIVNLLQKDKVGEAHQILVKSFSTCKKFDYAVIFYFR